MTSLEFIYTVVLRRPFLRRLANSTLRAITPRTLRCHGATVVLNPRDPVVSGALTLGAYELPETDFFLRNCRPGLTFLDIGANVGYYTALALSRMQGQGRIIALEPDPESFRYLQATVDANHGAIATCIQKAASNCQGSMTLYTSADNRGDSRLYPNELSEGSCEVEVALVDSMLDELGVASIDLVKIDVQGYEAHVIAGMARTIEQSPAMILLSEFWPYGLRSAGSDPAAYLSNLKASGLHLYELTNKSKLVPILDNAIIERFPGRQYTNVVGVKGTIAS